jgi:hypothetical protein
VQIEGEKIGHRHSADKLSLKRVDVGDATDPSDNDRCRGGNLQRGEGRSCHHDIGSVIGVAQMDATRTAEIDQGSIFQLAIFETRVQILMAADADTTQPWLPVNNKKKRVSIHYLF